MSKNIEIIFENTELLVINKPSGISVHNAEAEKNVLQLLSSAFTSPLHLIHRLDRETSGILAIAKSPKAAATYMKEFEFHKVVKKYLGVVCGKISTNETLKWDQTITDEGEGRRDPQGPKKNHKEALTLARPLKNNNFFTLCEFQLETGRQHQIRKHCVINGHALVGDDRYGNLKYNEKISTIYGVKRLALHCSELKFSSGEHFVAKMPDSFEKYFILKEEPNR